VRGAPARLGDEQAEHHAVRSVASQFRQAVASHVISSDFDSDTSSESEAEDEPECKEQQDEAASSRWRREYTPFERIEFLPPRHSRTSPAAATSALEFFSALFTPAFV
jgi:hypothetical protein